MARFNRLERGVYALSLPTSSQDEGTESVHCAHTDFGRVVPPHPSPLPWGEGGLCSTHELSPPQITRPPNRIPESSPHLSPLPKGEGQGEGKRSELKNPASKPTTGHQPFLSTAVLKHRTPHAAAILAAHSNFAERLECGGSPPLSFTETEAEPHREFGRIRVIRCLCVLVGWFTF